jgi:hypothetical protein
MNHQSQQATAEPAGRTPDKGHFDRGVTRNAPSLSMPKFQGWRPSSSTRHARPNATKAPKDSCLNFMHNSADNYSTSTILIGDRYLDMGVLNAE